VIRFYRVTAVLSFYALVSGCSTKGAEEGDCPVGAETCACTKAGICDAGLECHSMICVRSDLPSGGTSSSQGGNGNGGTSAATGGKPADAGSGTGGTDGAEAGTDSSGEGGSAMQSGGAAAGGTAAGGAGGSSTDCEAQQPCQKPGGASGVCEQGVCGDCPFGDEEDACPGIYGPGFRCDEGTCVEN
jgi:hypothetical protein